MCTHAHTLLLTALVFYQCFCNYAIAIICTLFSPPCLIVVYYAVPSSQMKYRVLHRVKRAVHHNLIIALSTSQFEHCIGSQQSYIQSSQGLEQVIQDSY
mmetsp:Transcript_33923/g.57604  ORF Transcript_33923/g.57604 Transcript_33923/m.57604 type:complete len:99 (-) Transcript_33923:115-411(-)